MNPMPVGKKTMGGILLCLGLMAATGDHSFKVDVPTIKWTPMHVAGLPDGVQGRSLHENPRTKMSSSMVKYPKGYQEPRHFHITCGHYIYVLKGRLRSPEGDLPAGTFTYAAPNEQHGPYNAVEETEILFYTDGPFDFHVANKQGK
jgi:quercetin dioxygenase-like cupin family protein